MKQSTQIMTFLSAKTGLLVQSQEPAETRPRSNLRELLFQGTISKLKHQRNVFMAGTEYFGETAQPRDHIPINTMRKSHFRGTDKTISNHA